MNTVVLRGVTFLSKYFIASFYFWIYVLRGFVVYGLLSVACALSAVIKDIQAGRDEDKGIHTLFKEYVQLNKNLKLPSLLLSFLLALLFLGFYYINQMDSSISLLCLIMLFYILGMTLILGAYFVHFYTFVHLVPKQAFVFSFVYSIKKWFYSLLILLAMILIITLSSKNLIIFIFFSPFVTSLVVTFILDKADLPHC